MTTRARLTALTLLGGAGSLCWQTSSALDASTPSSGDSTTLETVIVTAEKRPEALQDVPMSVTALSGGELDRLQARSFADYAALVPGLSLETAQPGNTRLTLRGQNAGGVGSTVAVYIDESPFGSSTALANGGVNAGDFDTWDMQRIEVLRGPQGTLYGANSEGGLLKFETNAPLLGSLSGAAEVTGQSVDHGGNGGDVHAMANLPLGDMMAFRVSGFYQDVPGYINDPLSGERDVNDGHQEGGRASLLVKPTDALSIRLTAESQQAKYNGTNLVDINPVTLQPLYGNLAQERSLQEPSSFKYENYSATIDWSPGPLSVLSSTSYGIIDADTDVDGTPVYGGLAGLFFGPTASGALLDDNVSTKKFTQGLRLTSPSSNALEWQVGGYYTREASVLNEVLNAAELPAGTQVGLIEQPVIDSVYKETAGFRRQLTYHFEPTAVRYSAWRPIFPQRADLSADDYVQPSDIADTPGCAGKLERQCVHLFGRAKLARGCEHHGVRARGDRLSPGRTERPAAAARRPGCAEVIRCRQDHQCRARDSIDAAERHGLHRCRGLPRRLEGHPAPRGGRGIRHQHQRRYGANAGTGMDVRLRPGAWPEVSMDRRFHRGESHLTRDRIERQFRRPAAIRPEVDYGARRPI